MEKEPKSIEKLCVALDTSCLRDALQLADSLAGVVGYFKVGLELFSAAGPAAVESLVGRGHNVFLDLKLYDIPNTVARAVRQVSTLGASFLTIHASGGVDMIKAAREAAEKYDTQRLKLLAVTILTSTTEQTFREIFPVEKSLEQVVLNLAVTAKNSGADGVVASAREANSLKKHCGNNFIIVTPGIRPEGHKTNDQKRTTTPTEAITAGSDLLVIGRPITEDKEPRKIAEQILKEIELAEGKKS
ncbi:MAG: orotidine-5'-phosphate decarboxylase [Planctomycetota bacterium]